MIKYSQQLGFFQDFLDFRTNNLGPLHNLTNAILLLVEHRVLPGSTQVLHGIFVSCLCKKVTITLGRPGLQGFLLIVSHNPSCMESFLGFMIIKSTKRWLNIQYFQEKYEKHAICWSYNPPTQDSRKTTRMTNYILK